MSEPISLLFPEGPSPAQVHILSKDDAPKGPFIPYIITNKANRWYLLIALVITLVEFTAFKFCYPFADFFSDSYSYIFAAKARLDINIWPIGYSKFLVIFHQLTASDTALVAFQYFTIQLALLYFFFTLRYIISPSKKTSGILFVFFFLNPLSLCFCNIISSDPLFAAVSIYWFTSLLWIIERPQSWQLVNQGVTLLLAFTLRHTAVYYPIPTAAAFFLSKHRIWAKWAGMLLGPVLMVLFAAHEERAALKMYGIAEFSPMSGWLLANNALYMYFDIRVDSNEFSSSRVRELNRMTWRFFRGAPPDLSEYLYAHSGSFFLHIPQSPLKEYAARYFPAHDDLGTVISWGKASPTFRAFGASLISHHFLAYLHDFVWLNTRKYFYPPLDKMQWYNMNGNQVAPIEASWFGYKTNRVWSVSKTAFGSILLPYPALFMLVNMFLVMIGVYTLVQKRKTLPPQPLRRIIFLTGVFLTANFAFSVGASIVVFRYEFAPFFIATTFSLLLLDAQQNARSAKLTPR